MLHKAPQPDQSSPHAQGGRGRAPWTWAVTCAMTLALALALALATSCGLLASTASGAGLPISVASADGTIKTVDAAASERLAAATEDLTGAAAGAAPGAPSAPVQQIAEAGGAAISKTPQDGGQVASAAPATKPSGEAVA